ncbi:MAG: polyprenol monophosphomannose synthase [Candidatus Omnitrophota bacterium]
MPMDFSLVIPTYNEGLNIKGLCGQLIGALENLHCGFEIIFVDDNSPDGTWRVAEALAREDKRVRVIRRMGKRGLASAVVSAWALCRGDVIGVIDGDMQHPAAALEKMLNSIVGCPGVDIVIASRYIAGSTVLNRSALKAFKSKLAVLFGRIFIPEVFKLTTDPLSGYFILRKKVVEGVKLTPIGYKILLEVLSKGKYEKIIDMPYAFGERKNGRSKAGLRQSFISLVHFIKLRRSLKPRVIIF